MPLVLRSYLAQNILQPYYESSIADPRLWVMLALSADHVDFIDFVTAYAHAHPSSKTTTELLLLLDKLVQGNRDALVALVTIDLSTQAAFTRGERPDAYEVLLTIQAHYQTREQRRCDLRRGVNDVLEAENGRWLMMSYERLRRFGYRFDTY